MSRRWLLFLVCLGCALFSFSQVNQITSARFEVSVDEAATRISFRELAPEVTLVVKNGSSESIRAAVRIELLEPNNTVHGTTERKVELKSGNQTVPFTLPAKTFDLTPDEDDEILWYRLHYRVTPESSNSSNQTIEGFISLSEITPDLFELRILAPKSALPGKPFTARVRAAHPVSRRPFKNVEVKGLITLTDDKDHDVSLTSSSITDPEGIAELTFNIPTNVDSDEDEFDLNIEGRLGLVTVKAEREIDISNRPSLVVSTDKPLYQPGQTIFARLLMLGPSKRAVADEEIDVEITDPEGTTVFSSTLKTSRFGIASVEWQVPDSTRLGDYRLHFESSDDDDQSAEATVKISRYDLPTFAVNVKSDRPYYLASQNATIEVKADYLFGKPVNKGHVRVVRETERQWNYREQKYETTEGDKYEGDTQADGVFKAQIPLSEDHTKLAGEDYNRFTDLRYAAYFTDSSTNRTEQRRFNIRLTKEAIHIYVIHERNSYYAPKNLPLKFYVSTFYADGTPVSTNLTIRSGDTEGQASMRVLRQVRTNRYGLAAIDQLRLSPAELVKSDLEFIAEDKTGNRGKHTETFSIRDTRSVRVSTSKPLLASGEPIEATITSTEPSLPVTLILARDRYVLHSQEIKLQNGRATVLIPYQKEFKDELTLSAFAESVDSDGDDELIRGVHTVLYPRKRDLNLNLVSASETYKPGELAHVKFQSTSPDGKGIESALGVVVIDRAVDERIRTDEEFGSRYSGFYNNLYSLIGYGESIGEISRKSLDELDMRKPVSKDLALAAEIILNQGYDDYSMEFGGYGYERRQSRVFVPFLERELTPVTNALKSIYASQRVYPKDPQGLQRLLNSAGINFSSLKDPWGTPYRPTFLTEQEWDTFSLKSAGADKRFDTEDDFSFCRLTWSYFRPIGEVIDAAVKEYHATTGDYIRNIEVLRNELSKKNLNLESLRDPWNQRYSFVFEPSGRYLEIRVTTHQPVAAKTSDSPYEFAVWSSRLDYFADHRARIDQELARQFRDKGSWPGNESELHAALKQTEIDTTSLRDPWGRKYYFNFQLSSFYGDRVKVESRSNFGQASTEKVQITPVTKKLSVIKIRSAGPDAQEGTYDDFDLATFVATLSEQAASDDKPKATRANVSFSGAKGAVTGYITDSIGAVVAGARVKATLQGSEELFEAESDENGKYLLRNLPAGIYELSIDGAGFKKATITQVVIRSSELVEVNVTLEVGAVSETVAITADGVNLLETSSASISTKVQSKLVFLAPGIAAAKQQLSTPRVREYFPETLLWQPQLTTDKKGRAQLDFKLADNITTWRMSVIGSTEDGEIGTAETEIRAFQPFFAELDPPRVLTEGDRISLPVVLRNYLDRKQSVDLTLKPETWFKVLDTNQKRSQVSAGESQNEVFNLQAIAAIKDGKQQVTAIGSDFSDAVEKPVTVHPDGEEKAETASDLLDTNTTLEVNLPENTIANSARVEVKIYPNLMTHVWESVEGIMKRPYGCGEQTISSTYPSLLVLRYLKNERQDPPMAVKAKKYLSEGYQRLLGYQSSNGGFSYWGNGDPDVALTAYAIRFLHDAATVMNVDASVERRAGQWLLSQQQSDGRWAAVNWDKHEDLRRTAMLTALVARSLALVNLVSAQQNAPAIKTEKPALRKALDYIEAQANGIDEPYLVASYSLASSMIGENVRAEQANSKLKSFAHTEGPRTYWALETNTPFYGWGLAGRIETTALAVQALAKGRNQTDQDIRNLQTRGLLFLLHNKDRYGVWYSTQATINVLDAMLSLMTENTSTRQNGAPGVDVIVNGETVRTIVMPTDKRMTAPFTMDVSSHIRTGKNQIEFRRASGGSPLSLQIVNTYYTPWKTSDDTTRVRSGDAETLKLETRFNKYDARVMDEITCYVKAERVGFRGYGMMLAEIGLPPGADVDRASLETAVKGSDWSISQYDVLPDRVIVYLWPRAGGSEFSFKFRPRMAMTAKSAASTIYDYYNPEAKAVVAPGTFVVR